jgi:sugar phosphate isomerase/epimerase
MNRSFLKQKHTLLVKVAGQDPASILKKLKHRIRFIHIKDGPAQFSEKLIQDNPDPMSPIGQGACRYSRYHRGLFGSCAMDGDVNWIKLLSVLLKLSNKAKIIYLNLNRLV